MMEIMKVDVITLTFKIFQVIIQKKKDENKNIGKEGERKNMKGCLLSAKKGIYLHYLCKRISLTTGQTTRKKNYEESGLLFIYLF